VLVFADGQAFAFALPGGGGARAGGHALDGDILSPMPGRVIALDAAQGVTVARGQKLLTLEAMKMEHSLAAPFDGMVTEVNVVQGAQVSEGTLLVRIEKGEEE
jgi:3-methylcrotonyl-CoA carboxylase alpha subunit